MQGLATRNNKFLHFYDLLVKGLCHRPVKAPESIHIRCLCPSCVQSQQSPRTITAILLYTNYTKKQSPDCTSSIIFCFAQNPFRYSENLSLFFKIPTHSGGQTPVCHILPHLILTAGLFDPAQLIGRYQLFEIVHPLPQHLALVGVLHQDAVVLGLQNVFLGMISRFSLTAFSALSKGWWCAATWSGWNTPACSPQYRSFRGRHGRNRRRSPPAVRRLDGAFAVLFPHRHVAVDDVAGTGQAKLGQNAAADGSSLYHI